MGNDGYKENIGEKNLSLDEEFGLPADLLKEYETDGGRNYIPVQEQHKTLHEALLNGPIWEKAKKAAEHAEASDKWAFTMWWYKKHGGK